MRDMKKLWDDSSLEITEENVRRVFTKENGFRVTLDSSTLGDDHSCSIGYPSLQFILAGEIKVLRDNVPEFQMGAPARFVLPAGSYYLKIIGPGELRRIYIFDLDGIVAEGKGTPYALRNGKIEFGRKRDREMN